jgi:hypothetical protein
MTKRGAELYLSAWSMLLLHVVDSMKLIKNWIQKLNDNKNKHII